MDGFRWSNVGDEGLCAGDLGGIEVLLSGIADIEGDVGAA